MERSVTHGSGARPVEKALGAITSINSVSITAAATGTQLASSLTATDSSTSALDFDGLLTQAFKTDQVRTSPCRQLAPQAPARR